MERKSGMNLSNNYAVEFYDDGSMATVWRVDNLIKWFGGTLDEIDGKFFYEGNLCAQRLDETFKLDYSPNEPDYFYVLTGPGVEHHFNDEQCSFGDYEDLGVRIPFKYGGGSLWAKGGAHDVFIDFIRIPGDSHLFEKIDEDDDQSEDTFFEVWFNRNSWYAHHAYGELIYTDATFKREVQDRLRPLFGDEVVQGIEYTESGGQGYNYVHMQCQHPKFREKFKHAQEVMRGFFQRQGELVDF